MYEVSIIQHIQSIRSAFLDGFFLVVTNLGAEMLFIVVAAIFYWCVSKRYGYKMMNVIILGAACMEGLKNIVRRPRPFTHDGIVSVGEETSGYSFPSGHSHAISNLSTQLYLKYRRRELLISGIIVSLIVAFSRLYLGQHFLTDVIVGLALGICFATLFSMLFEVLGNREEYIVLGVFPICVIIELVLIFTGAAATTGPVQDVLGAYAAITLGYFIEKRYIKCEVRAAWYVQLIKIVVGLGVSLGIKEGFKLFLPQSAPALYNFFRYFVTAFVAVAGLPALFRITKLYGNFGKPLPEKATEANTATETAKTAETEELANDDNPEIK